MSSTNVRRLLVPLLLSMTLAINFTKISGQFDLASAPLPEVNSVNVSQPMRQPDGTVRVDPLDHLKKYRGGFDITNKHYWSSVVFTGAHGYAIAFVWLFCGIIYGIYLLVAAYLNKRNEKPKTKSLCYKQCYLWPVILAIIFTILAIVASGLAIGGITRFHSEAKRVVNIVMHTANEASETIVNTTGAMRAMRMDLGETNGTAEASAFLTSTSEKLDVEAADIERQARKNRRLIDKGLKIVFIFTIVTVSLNLVAVFACLVAGILKVRRALYLLIALCWFLTILCWLFFGVYFFLENFSGDTCKALENFQENPYNNSLTSILPCGELLSAKSVLSDVSAGIYELVNEVNMNISDLQGTTYQTLAYVCNPFSAPPDYTYQPENCPSNSIKIGDIPKVLFIFTCSDTNNGTCKEGEFISKSEYRTVEAYTTSIQTLLNAYPDMESLVECQSVKDAFSEILRGHCRPLKRSARMAWGAIVCLSIIMVFLVVIWTTQARHEQRLHSFDVSVKPQFATATTNSLELQANNGEGIKDHHHPDSV